MWLSIILFVVSLAMERSGRMGNDAIIFTTSLFGAAIVYQNERLFKYLKKLKIESEENNNVKKMG